MPMPPNIRFTATGRNGASSSRMKSGSNDNLRSVARIERSEIRDGAFDAAKAAPGFAGAQPGLQLDQRRPLFRLDIGRLDDWPPLLDLGALKRRKRLWRLLVARRNLQPEIGEPPTNGSIRQRADRCGVELGENILRHPLRAEKPIPRRHVESR